METQACYKIEFSFWARIKLFFGIPLLVQVEAKEVKKITTHVQRHMGSIVSQFICRRPS